MRTTYFLFLCILAGSSSFGQPKVTIADFENLDNSKWIGNLKYVNYGDGHEVTLKTTMQIFLEGNKILINTQYPMNRKQTPKKVSKLRKMEHI